MTTLQKALITATLLTAYRTGADPALLKEAMEEYPHDPQVAFEAVFDKDLSPEQQRQWLNTFEQSASDNALANHLSARNYFNSGQKDQAVQELNAASGKQQLQNYTLERWIDDEEACLSAGYSVNKRALCWKKRGRTKIGSTISIAGLSSAICMRPSGW